MSEIGSVSLRTWLQEIYDEHGYLTPEIVREAARPAESPGHLAVFGVDASEAAEAYYLGRARNLIQSVRIVMVEKTTKEPLVLRSYHAVPGGEERAYVYRSVEDLVKHPDQLQLARNEAKRRLNEAERSLQSLDLLVPAESKRQTKRAITSIRAAQKALAAV